MIGAVKATGGILGFLRSLLPRREPTPTIVINGDINAPVVLHVGPGPPPRLGGTSLALGLGGRSNPHRPTRANRTPGGKGRRGHGHP